MSVNRRTVVRTAAWTAPAVAVAAASPAFAGTTSTLSFTATWATAALATDTTACNDLDITINNSGSSIPLVMSNVEVLFMGNPVASFGANTIAAGATYSTSASEQGQSVPSGLNLNLRITFADATGAQQTMLVGVITTGTCGSTSSNSHTSTAP